MSDPNHKQPQRFPQEFPNYPEKYSEEIVAIDRIELENPQESQGNAETDQGSYIPLNDKIK